MDNGISRHSMPSIPTVNMGSFQAAEAQQGDYKTFDSHSHINSGLSVYHRTVSLPMTPPELDESENHGQVMTSPPGQIAFNKMESSFTAEDITIKDPEFSRLPFKKSKLALAIKLFCISFKDMIRINNPETDRSSVVESIRSKVLTVTSSVTLALFSILSCATSTAIGVGITIGILTLCTTPGDAAIGFIFAIFASISIAIGLFLLGLALASLVDRLITATVAASADTCEKLTELTASPEEKFLKKYQRMEDTLRESRIKLYAAESKMINDMTKLYEKYGETEKLKLVNERCAKLDAYKVEAGIPDLDNDKWFDNYQRRCLRDSYEGDIKELREAIRKTKDWLNRAAKQKELLTCQYSELQELNGKVATKQSIATVNEAKYEAASAGWLPV
ncbi:hypothetical protein [Endozoicomonas sp. SCSIO W0465]|uniref:hypothetical protein n=1 Tax=Endozoicomonas sp. SCSIO W0465 TaxID=2918516 RepID=UPI002075D35B|nr:hypothetical protein [Endozoicomonas sp. SCSIO W0465]USE37807.1 hypothetical protein MJO57_06335 [Endozoicomonas sp. SCSIO W0465]